MENANACKHFERFSKHERKRKRKGKKSRDKVKAVWDARAHALFIKFCLAEVRAGNRPTTFLTSKGWDNVERKFKAQTGRRYTRTQFKNHWDFTKKDWSTWKFLVGNEKELDWDSARNTIVNDDEWWEDKIKNNIAVKKFRDKGLPHAAECEELFEKNTATGVVALPLNSAGLAEDLTGPCGTGDMPLEIATRESKDGNSGESKDDNSGESNNDSSGESENENSAESISEDIHEAAEAAAMEREKKRARGCKTTQMQDWGKMLEKLNRLMDAVMDATENRSTASSSLAMTREKGYTIKGAMDLLHQIPGIKRGDDFYMLGTRLFMNKDNREMFYALSDSDTRMTWLKQEKDRESAQRSRQLFL